MGLIDASADDYVGLLERALPPGRIWRAWLKSGLRQILQGLAPELARVHGRVNDAWRELFPGTADELLPEWEAILGMPFPCAPAPTTLSDRQAAALAQLVARGAVHEAFYVTVAAAIGVEVTINVTPRIPFRTGWSHCGERLWDEFQVYVWEVIVADTISSDARLRLECLFESLRQAHTVVIFTYP